MLKILKFAAIDVGSNAVRLLVENVFEVAGKPQFKKQSLVRVPLRLGMDVFKTGEISEAKKNMLVLTIESFKNLMDAHGVIKYKACATSALRESANSAQIVKEIQEKAGIKVHLITGPEEAKYLSNVAFEEFMNHEDDYLYMDVGGGSVEYTFFSKGQKLIAKSFKMGTIRLLEEKVSESDWDEMCRWLRKNVQGLQNLSIVGTGGNINRYYRLANKKDYQPLDYKSMKRVFNVLNSLTYEERIIQFKLNPDRADVIIPAGNLFIKVMETVSANHIHVPKMGLADGIVRELYKNYKKK
ncbi:MAG: exopolyphosphatase/guanosine-5'-triphosphate,3'-diphosphate pyrophosphatase [Sphingobacteriales bacterium]|jgi:exopolyphosphatase/guanosine-5'-triphosphate,3'-diphosphate pyrophosphatase